MRIGFFGGSFDPVHNGHLELARCCQRQASLDEVWFTPAAVQPLKERGPQAPAPDRMLMLALAITGALGDAPSGSLENYVDAAEVLGAYLNPTDPSPRFSWRICSLEVNRGGVSYTVDTLRDIHAERPDDELFILLGSDTLRDIGSWREPEEIFRLARPLFVHRAGTPQAEVPAVVLESITADRVVPPAVEMPAMKVSSTEIRALVAAGQPIDEFVPPAVARYIAKNALYR